MVNLTPQQKQLMWVLKCISRASILSFLRLGTPIVYFGEKSPTAADRASGRISFS